MAVTTRIVRATGQIEWTGPTPSILDAGLNNLVGDMYVELEQPTAAGAWGDESNESWVEFEVSEPSPVQFGCAPIPAPETPLSASATQISVACTFAHTDITADTPFHPILFDSRAASIGWDDTSLMLTASGLATSDSSSTYPTPPVAAYKPTVYASTDPVRVADLVALLNSGFAYFGFSYGGPGVFSVSTCRVFEAWIELTYSGRKYPLRRHPRSDGYGLGPKRHYPPPETRRHAGGYK